MTLGDDWDDYERGVVPREAGANQRTETRRAFYSGARAVLRRLRRLGQDDVTEREGIDALLLMVAECRAFAGREADAGRAGTTAPPSA